MVGCSYNDIGVGSGGRWVAKSIEIKFPPLTLWPRLHEIVNLETYCGGVGNVFAQRIVKIHSFENSECAPIEASTVWVSVDKSGKPSRIPDWLEKGYPQVKRSKAPKFDIKVPDIENSKRDQFALRETDIDANGHVNNAVALSALVQVGHVLREMSPSKVEITYMRPILRDEKIELISHKSIDGFEAWLISDNTISCSMKWISANESSKD